MNPYGSKRNWSGRSAESVVKEMEEIDADLVKVSDGKDKIRISIE